MIQCISRKQVQIWRVPLVSSQVLQKPFHAREHLPDEASISVCTQTSIKAQPAPPPETCNLVGTPTIYTHYTLLFTPEPLLSSHTTGGQEVQNSVVVAPIWTSFRETSPHSARKASKNERLREAWLE